MADRVDAAAHAVRPAVGDAARDRRAVQTAGVQLRGRHPPMPPCSLARDEHVGGCVVLHP
jgi:hypothetical protein